MEQSSTQRWSTILSRLSVILDDDEVDEFSVEIIGNDTFEDVEVVGCDKIGEKLSIERKSFSLVISTTGTELSSWEMAKCSAENVKCFIHQHNKPF